MDLKTVLFFGRSGSGKGTQVELLTKYLLEKDPERKVLHIATGDGLRKLAEGDSYGGRLVDKIISVGELMPTFIPIWVWTGKLLEEYTGKEHLILDGLARRPIEAPVLHHALKFYDRAKGAEVVLIDVSDKWATERLLARGREDDKGDDIKRRLDWFNAEVKESIAFFENKPKYYQFHIINGEQTIEEVHKEILSKLKI